MKYVTKDSGKRQDYESGMKRDVQEGKPRYDLIYEPMLTRWAELMARGAEKYGGDTPITSKNWDNIVKSICTCKKSTTTTTENQTVTQKENTLAGECVSSATPVNIQKQGEPSATQNESHMSATCAGRVTTESLKPETPNMLENKGKTTTNGSRTTLSEDDNWGIGTSDCQKPNLENLLKKECEHCCLLGCQLKTNKSCSICKKTSVQFASNHQTESISTSTTTTTQEKLEDSFAENATKDSVCLETIKNELKKHSNTCKIHLSIAYDNGKPYIPASCLNNWQLAFSIEEMNRFKASAFRHFVQWWRGDNDEDHAAAVFFNISAYEYVKERINGTRT